MTKFEQYFNEPACFSNSTYVLNGAYSVTEAAAIFSEYFDDEVSPDMLSTDLVRYGYPPENVEDREELGACWFSGARNIPGSKPVWVINTPGPLKQRNTDTIKVKRL